MFHTYEEALSWVHARLRLGIKPGLLRMEWMMERLNHPERRIKPIHIAGTNGKGSTLTFLRCILEEAGYTVGTFTSPYFERFNERISVNGIPISDEDMLKLINIIRPLADELEATELGGPTEFEVITAMAFVYFAKQNPVDVVILEVGLGGRFDSTNIIHPLVSIITSIGMDHVNILGDTYEKIASEKAGIIKSGTAILSAVKQPEAVQVIEAKAKALRAPLYQLGSEFRVTHHQSLARGEEFNFSSMFHKYSKLTLSMLGQHQTENASLAIMASQLLANYYALQIEESHIRQGLQWAYWPGRLEIISEQPLVMIDGAHNQEGIEALVAELNERYQDKTIKIIFTALADKKLNQMIAKLDSVADSITFTEFDYPRASTAASLYEISTAKNKHINPDWHACINDAIPTITETEILVVTGSLYFLSQVKPELIKILKTQV